MRINYLFLGLMFVLAGCGTLNCVCPDIYSPVCGVNGKTYGNACTADCDDVDYIQGECPVYGLGEVQFSGDSLCGYYIVITGITYKPSNLEEAFQVHGITVGLRYRKMQDWITCDDPYNHAQEIQILDIEKLVY